jgi:hypothetical protein
LSEKWAIGPHHLPTPLSLPKIERGRGAERSKMGKEGGFSDILKELAS